MSPSEDTETKQASTNSDTSSSWHQLLIIGNGFDLECGLNSTYEDFFSTERESLIPARFLYEGAYYPTWKESASNPNLTLWDLILKEQRKESWYDIEAAILKQVLNINETLLTLTSIDNFLSKKDDQLDHYDIDYLHSFGLLYDIHEYIFLRHDGTIFSSKKTLSIFMLNQLNKLESAFAEYLHEQTSRKPLPESGTNEHQVVSSYEDAVKNKLRTLLSFGIQEDKYRAQTYPILSFNYTGPFDISSNEIGQSVAYTNIHGLCREGEEIIFGIDGKETLVDEITRPFTKTYRLLSLGGPKARDVVRSDTQCIKFYGHSLSGADYSYFQAIFDAVHLYSSDVSLVFFYRCFDERDPLIHRSEMMDKVINLLTAYGTTLENKDHGKNLIHKLLLEGRLTVQEINFPTQSDIVD